MLTVSAALRHLLHRRLIEPQSLMLRAVRITNVARRNHNYHVTGLGSQDYFLKQGRHDLDIGSVANEAHAFRTLQSPPFDRTVGKYLPRCVEYDAETGILTLESVPHAEDLHQYHTRRGRFPKKLAVGVGKALGLLHASTLGSYQGETARLHKVLPTVFCLHRPPLDILRGASGVGIQLIKLVQKYARIAEEFDRLTQQWAAESVIHGDIKLSNWLAFRRRVPGRLEGVKLIDWEFAGIGDPRWDVGCVFGSYLGLWLFSVPIARGDRPDQLVDLARFPLEKIQPAMRVFWSTYRETRGLGENIALEWLTNAIRFAAASLIQTAYEFSKDSTFLTAEIACLVQLSLNMLQQPEQAACHLLGLNH